MVGRSVKYVCILRSWCRSGSETVFRMNENVSYVEGFIGSGGSELPSSGI